MAFLRPSTSGRHFSLLLWSLVHSKSREQFAMSLLVVPLACLFLAYLRLVRRHSSTCVVDYLLVCRIDAQPLIDCLSIDPSCRRQGFDELPTARQAPATGASVHRIDPCQTADGSHLSGHAPHWLINLKLEPFTYFPFEKLLNQIRHCYIAKWLLNFHIQALFASFIVCSTDGNGLHQTQAKLGSLLTMPHEEQMLIILQRGN